MTIGFVRVKVKEIENITFTKFSTTHADLNGIFVAQWYDGQLCTRNEVVNTKAHNSPFSVLFCSVSDFYCT